MPSRRRGRRTLSPSFVVAVAAAAVACDGLGPARGRPFLDSDQEQPPPACTRPDGCVSHNPPPPTPGPPPRPDFGTTITQDVAPPPLGAASIIVASDGTTAVVTDPDRDRVVTVDLATKKIREVPLEAGDEPGRIVEDGDKRAHVVLGRAGAVATIDLATAKLLERRTVCPAPQGIARDGASLFIACAGGEIVTLPVAGAEPAKVLARVDRDLRDIVVSGDTLLVSRLRSAEVLLIAKTDGALLSRGIRAPVETTGLEGNRLEPSVGWRLIRSASGGAVLVHQMAEAALVDAEQPQAYAGLDPCGGPVRTSVTRFEPSASGALAVAPGAFLGDAVVPVDIARAPDGVHWAAIAAGNGHNRSFSQVHLLTGLGPDGTCTMQPSSHTDGFARIPTGDPPGQAVAVTFTPSSELVVFTREPAAVHRRSLAGFFQPPVAWETIALPGPSREDTGHAIFHSNTGGRVACASCHPGGGDDGRVWKLSTGARRTQSLQGTLEGTAPYHWAGDVPGIEAVATDVFAKKMGGQVLDAGQVGALQAWVTRIPAAHVSPPLDADASARGKALFEDATVGCSGCHSGPKLTNNASVDVGTGGTFQVPSLLGLALRAPYLHDGRATTLQSGFGPNGAGDSHGKTSLLSPSQLTDLVIYLDTL